MISKVGDYPEAEIKLKSKCRCDYVQTKKRISERGFEILFFVLTKKPPEGGSSIRNLEIDYFMNCGVRKRSLSSGVRP